MWMMEASNEEDTRDEESQDMEVDHTPCDIDFTSFSLLLFSTNTGGLPPPMGNIDLTLRKLAARSQRWDLARNCSHIRALWIQKMVSSS